MNGNGRSRSLQHGGRCGPRVYSLSEIAISYEGQDEQITVKPPNLSLRGMFINTSRSFPEGAVLNLRFRLMLTRAEIRTRAEVRHCDAGVGIGVEFIGLSPDAQRVIQREVSLSQGQVALRTTRPLPKKRRSSARRKGGR